jgi:hypothetical protein
MFDTIHIEIPNQCIEGLENKSDTIDSETGEVKYSVGYSDCIKVRKVKEGTKIECSLSKLLKGNNIYSLSFSEVILALKMIESKLGIPIQKGIIKRLDCEYTLETILKPQEYFRYFGDCRYLVRSTIQNTSLYYQNKSRIFNFYDKIKESKSKRGFVPEEFKNMHIMRCEFRYNNTYLKSMAKKMNLGFLTIENLLDKKIYNQIAELVYIDYQSITKIKKSYFDPTTLNSKARFEEQLVADGIEFNGGLNAILEKIDASRAFNPSIPKEYFSRRKTELKKIMTCRKENIFSNSIDEINKKIEIKYMKTIK